MAKSVTKCFGILVQFGMKRALDVFFSGLKKPFERVFILLSFRQDV